MKRPTDHATQVSNQSAATATISAPISCVVYITNRVLFNARDRQGPTLRSTHLMMTICKKNVPFLEFMALVRLISTQLLACMLCNIVDRRPPESSRLTGSIFMHIVALAMLVKILMRGRLKCKHYMVMLPSGITAIQQVEKPMPSWKFSRFRQNLLLVDLPWLIMVI